MRSLDWVRFVIFVVLHIFVCLAVFLFAKGYMNSRSTAEPVDSMYVDGTDFTPIANLGVAAFNGIVSLVTGLFGIVAMVVISTGLLLPFRFLALEEASRVTAFEVRGTLAVILGGVALTMLAGILCMGVSVLVWMGIMFVPVLLYEVILYWLSLRRRRREGMD